MLKLFHKYRKQIFWGMAILIIPSFVFFGISVNMASGQPGVVAGYIGKKKIPTSDFILQYQALRRQLTYLSGMNPDEIGNQANLQELTWDRLLLLHHAKKSRIRVKDQDVVQWLAEQSPFSPDGVFNQQLYKLFVERQLGITLRRFEEEIRDMLTIQRVLASLKDETQVDEAQVRQTFLRRFAPKDLKYTIVDKSHLTESVEVTDAELENFYEGLKKSLVNPRSVSARYIQIEDEAAAQSIIDQIEIENAIPQDLTEGQTGARIQSFDSITERDSIPGLGYSNELTQSLFAIEAAGDLSSWIEHEKGRVRFQLVGKTDEAPIPKEEALATIRQQLTDHKTNLALYEVANQYRARIQDEGFEAMAQAQNLDIMTFEGYKPGTYLDKVGMVPLFDMQTDEVDIGETALPVKLDKGYALIQLVKLDETYSDGWDEKKDSLTQELQSRAQMDAYQTKLTTLRSQLKVDLETMDTLFP